MICGGESLSGETDLCYWYDQQISNWKSFDKMELPRFAASSSVNNGSLWVSGGEESFGGYLKSTEYIKQGGSIISGIDLPEARFSHCTGSVITVVKFHSEAGEIQ